MAVDDVLQDVPVLEVVVRTVAGGAWSVGIVDRVRTSRRRHRAGAVTADRDRDTGGHDDG